MGRLMLGAEVVDTRSTIVVRQNEALDRRNEIEWLVRNSNRNGVPDLNTFCPQQVMAVHSRDSLAITNSIPVENCSCRAGRQKPMCQ